MEAVIGIASGQWEILSIIVNKWVNPWDTERGAYQVHRDVAEPPQRQQHVFIPVFGSGFWQLAVQAGQALSQAVESLGDEAEGGLHT
jgi:hypothetical protein